MLSTPSELGGVSTFSKHKMRKRKSDENAVGRPDEIEETTPETLNQQFKEGDLTWVEIHNSSWWPAQVVDEERVSTKLRKKSKDELLVRLYGSYKYMYVDASKSNSEFKDVLKRENKTIEEKFQEALKQDMSLILTKGQSELESSTPKGNDLAEVPKVKNQRSGITQEFVGKEAENISTVMKVCTNKEKIEGSSRQKRKLELSKEVNEEKKAKSRISNVENPKSKRQKVAKHAELKNYESSIVRQSPSVASVLKTPTNNLVKEAMSENQEEIKAKDLEIRKIVRDILFGGIINLSKNQSPKSREDSMQGGTSNLQASRMNSQYAAEKSGLKATTYSRKTMSPKQGDGEMKCTNRKNERVKGSKEAVNKVLGSPNSNGAKKSRAEEVTPNSPELEAGTPPEVIGTAEEKGLLSERQVRVMQSLALIAPAGSPFKKNGLKN